MRIRASLNSADRSRPPVVKGLEAEGIGFGLAPLWSGHVLEDALRVEEQLLGLIELPEGRQRGAKQALCYAYAPVVFAKRLEANLADLPPGTKASDLT